MANETSFPENWQEQIQSALDKAREANPTKEVFGLLLPTSWKHELIHYVQNGEVRKLFRVKAVAFGGKVISVFDAPGEKTEAKVHKKV